MSVYGKVLPARVCWLTSSYQGGGYHPPTVSLRPAADNVRLIGINPIQFGDSAPKRFSKLSFSREGSSLGDQPF